MAKTLEVALKGFLFNQECDLVRHYHSPTATSVPIPAEFCDQLAGQYEGLILPYQGVNYTCNSWVIRDVLPGSVGYAYSPPTWPLTGAGGSDSLPSFCCYSVQLNGIPGTKPTHGFARIGGVPTTLYANNHITPIVFSSMASDFRDYFGYAPTTAGGAGAWIPVIYSRKHGGFNPWADIVLNQIIGHQTSRHVGHGG